MMILGLAAPLILVFGGLLAQATPPPTSTAIPPGVWELVVLSPADGEPVTIADPSRYTLQFLPDGTLQAQVDCNRGRGGYTAAGGVLGTTPLATTRMHCGPGSHDTAFLRLLAAATAYQIDSEGLLLLSGDAGTLRLRSA